MKLREGTIDQIKTKNHWNCQFSQAWYVISQLLSYKKIWNFFLLYLQIRKAHSWIFIQNYWVVESTAARECWKIVLIWYTHTSWPMLCSLFNFTYFSLKLCTIVHLYSRNMLEFFWDWQTRDGWKFWSFIKKY